MNQPDDPFLRSNQQSGSATNMCNVAEKANRWNSGPTSPAEPLEKATLKARPGIEFEISFSTPSREM